ncbi:MAG: hypothetical protein ACI4WY_06775 [Anaerovoracaceae bacterium]
MDTDFLHFKREVIPKMMFELGLDRNPTFKRICQKTLEAGYSSKSAEITVYYLMRMLDLFDPVLEERSVKGLANAMNKIEKGSRD